MLGNVVFDLGSLRLPQIHPNFNGSKNI